MNAHTTARLEETFHGEGQFTNACLTMDSISSGDSGESVSLMVYTLLRLAAASMKDWADEMVILTIESTKK